MRAKSLSPIVIKSAEIFRPNLQNWRRTLLRCTNAMSDEQLNWIPPGGVNSAAWCVRHLAQSEDWFVRTVIRGEDYTPRRTKELLERPVLFAYLADVWAQTDAGLAEWDWEYLQQPRPIVPGFRDQPPPDMNVLWVVNQLVQHCAFHTGQVRMLTRMQGLELKVV